MDSSGTNSNPQKLTIQSILHNEYASPYSLQDFYTYTKKLKCEELVEFWKAVFAYQTKLTRLQSPTPDDSVHEDMALDKFKPQRNPSIFKYDNIETRQSPASNNEESNHNTTSKPVSLLKSIVKFTHGLVAADSGADLSKGIPRRPRATSDPHKVIREEVPVEYAVLPIVRESHASSLSVLADKVRELNDKSSLNSANAFQQELSYILNTFVKQGAPKEVNIPNMITKKLLRDYDLGVRGSALFQSAIEHVEMILRTSCLPGFLSYAASLPGSGAVTKKKGNSVYVEKEDGLELVKKMTPK